MSAALWSAAVASPWAGPLASESGEAEAGGIGLPILLGVGTFVVLALLLFAVTRLNQDR
jgi:hypothetical protein